MAPLVSDDDAWWACQKTQCPLATQLLQQCFSAVCDGTARIHPGLGDDSADRCTVAIGKSQCGGGRVERRRVARDWRVARDRVLPPPSGLQEHSQEQLKNKDSESTHMRQHCRNTYSGVERPEPFFHGTAPRPDIVDNCDKFHKRPTDKPTFYGIRPQFSRSDLTYSQLRNCWFS